MSFFKKFLNDKEPKEENIEIEATEKKADFRFPIIGDIPSKKQSPIGEPGFNKQPLNDGARSTRESQSTVKESIDELDSVPALSRRAPLRVAARTAVSDIRSKHNARWHDKKPTKTEPGQRFQPQEVPPPMHLIKRAEEKVIFELPDLSDQEPLQKDNLLTWIDASPVQASSHSLKQKEVLSKTKQVTDHINDSALVPEVETAVKPTTSQVVKAQLKIQRENKQTNYIYPSIELLQSYVPHKADEAWVLQEAEALEYTLLQFNVKASVVDYSQGPSITRFEIQPEPGVKVSKITNLADDLKLSLAAKEIRIEAPIPGKRTIGIEIPNRDARSVFIREILQHERFEASASPLTIAVGLDVSGQPIVTDLIKMPHGLVAGSTGSGKSVFVNSLLISLLYKSSPEDLQLLLIDPKMVELTAYNGLPHLLAPVITDPKSATLSLKWAVDEMERRYEAFAQAGVRDIVRFNEKALQAGNQAVKMPYIVVIIDELADLMMTAPGDVEEAICRIAQKARAAGIHLIIATQRPSVDVITGLIKANIPTRIAFSVSAQTDSRTILDQAGAEKLLGRGDLLFLENGTSKPIRLQGTFVTDDEIEQVVAHVKSQGEPEYLLQADELAKLQQNQGTNMGDNAQDELLLEACQFAVEVQAISTSSLQRRFRIGYNRAARMIDLLEDLGVISESNGSKPRNVLITLDEMDTLQELIEARMF